jgi:hypothetical protein
MYILARLVRGLCVGFIMAVVWNRHGWEWLAVVALLWLSQMTIEAHAASDLRRRTTEVVYR